MLLLSNTSVSVQQAIKRVSKVNLSGVLSPSVRGKAQEAVLPTEGQGPQLAAERHCDGSLSVQMCRLRENSIFFFFFG